MVLANPTYLPTGAASVSWRKYMCVLPKNKTPCCSPLTHELNIKMLELITPHTLQAMEGFVMCWSPDLGHVL